MNIRTTRLSLAALMVLAAASAHAASWGDFAIVSNTVGLNEGRLCVGTTSGSDLGCPSYAPSVTTAGDVSITGNVSANRFIGDGSALTGLTSAPNDRISTSSVASGANLGMVVADQGTISFTLGGTTGAAYLHPTLGFVGPGVSASSYISTSSGGYFGGNVGIGTKTPGSGLTISSSAATAFAIQTSGGQLAAFSRFSDTNNALYLSAKNAIQSSGNQLVFGNDAGTATVYFYAAGGQKLVANATGIGIGAPPPTPTATLQVSGSFTVSTSAQTTTPSLYVDTSGNVGIGTSTPSKPLTVVQSGSSAAATGLFYTYADNNSGEIVQARARGLVDSISAVASGDTLARFGAQGYTGTSFCHSSRIRMAADGSPATNVPGRLVFETSAANTSCGSSVERMRIDSTGNVGIGTTAPSQTLHVAGTALTTSWTGINFSSASKVTPTAPLEVSGTISATALVINGQSVTGGGGDRITSGTSNVTVNQSGNISFTTAGTEVMVISGSNVGIGTSSPGYALEVSSSNNTFRIRNTTVGGTAAVFDNPNTATKTPWIKFTAQNGTYTYGTYYASPYAMTLASQFNLMLSPGTEGGSTQAGVTVGYNDYINPPVQKFGVVTGGVGQIGAAVLGQSGQTADLQRWGIYTTGNGIIGGISYTTSAAVRSDGGAYFLGNLGVGTVTPTSVLQVSGTFTVSSTVTNSNPALYVSSSGNVGIGTTAPSATLDVSGSIKMAGNGAETCDSSHLGMIRFDPVTHRAQLCSYH